MIVFIAIAFIIILVVNYNNVKSENELLQKKIDSFPKYCSKCGNKILNSESVHVHNERVSVKTEKEVKKEPIKDESVKEVKIKSEPAHTDTEIKNSLILIIGSFLLVLSAILFLVTNWSTTGNYMKTFVLLFMLAIFYGASVVADKYLNIKQTSKAFYYISLAYIPIIFLSIFLFELFGRYFSLYGDGKYIYLLIMSIIVSIIYYVAYNKRQYIVTCIGSLLFTYLAIIFMGLSIKVDYHLVMLLLSLYTLLLNILYKKELYFLNSEMHYTFASVLSVILVVLNLSHNIEIIHYIVLIVGFINIYYALVLNSNYKNIYEFVYPAYLMYLFVEIAGYYNSNYMIQVSLITSITILYYYNIIRYKEVKLISFVESIVGITYLLMISIVYKNVIDLYIVLTCTTLLFLLAYIYSRKEYMATLFNISFPFLLCSIFYKFEISFAYIGIIFIIQLYLSRYVIKDEIMNKVMNPMTNIYFVIYSIFIITESNLIIPILYVLYAIYNLLIYKEESKEINKIIAYICIDFLTISLLFNYNLFSYDNLSIMISLSTLIVGGLSYLIKELNSKTNNEYIISHYVINIILLIIEFSITNLVLLIILGLLFMLFVYINNLNKNLYDIPVYSLIPYLFFSNILQYSSLWTLILIIIFNILLLVYKDKRYFYYLLIYVPLFAIINDYSFYLKIFLFIVPTFIQFVHNDFKGDKYKLALSIELFLLINSIIEDFDLENLTVFRYAPFMIWMIYVTRNIVKNHTKDYKLIEYIGSIIINLIVINSHYVQADGMYFITFLIILVMYTYNRKYGPYFLISLISIIVNTFIMTKEFWINLPWWIYVLIAGLVLISFAVNNEMKEKNVDKNLIKNIKEKLDL